jgi:hypothetical protein
MFTFVWRLSGLTDSEAGHLELRGGRLTFTPLAAEKPGFDVPITEVHDINFPWHYFGGGFKMRIAGEQYRFSFVEPHTESADIKAARDRGRVWKKLLLPSRG